MTVALTAEGLTRDFGGLRALDAVSIQAGIGERLAVLGPNGAGKTTLFNVVTGLLAPTAGRVRLFDSDITGLAPFRRARLGLGRTFQITTLFPRLTVLESVVLAVQGADPGRFSLLRPRTAYGHLFSDAERWLEDWGFADRGHALTRELSYGEQRQLELVLALAGRPKVLLLDEPTAGLSPAETAAVTAMIRGFPRDLTLLMIEHDMDVALDFAERVLVLHQGQLLAQGTPGTIRANGQVREIYMGVDEEA
jgi:branched-chain amino acid transport system ATP-binding protein